MEGDSSMSSTGHNGTEKCSCQLRCKLQTSWTERNPGRRFLGCGRYGSPGHCNLFAWYDPPTTKRAEKVINELLKKNKELTDLVEKLKEDLQLLKEEMKKKEKYIQNLHFVIGCTVTILVAKLMNMM